MPSQLLSSRRRGPKALFAAFLAVVLAALVIPAPAGAEDDPKAEQQQVRDKKASVEQEIDVLRASDSQIEAELSRLDGVVGQRQNELAAAQAAHSQAVATLDKAEADLAQKEAELASLREDMKTVAVQAYVHPQGDEVLNAMSNSDSMNDTVKASTMLEARNGSLDDLEDQYQKTQDELSLARDEADQARVNAEQAEQAASSRLSDVEAARNQQATLAADVDSRINARLAEASSLEAADAQLSAEIRSQQEALAAKLPPPAPASESSGSSGGSSSSSSSSSSDSAPARSSGPPPSITGSGSIVSVGGIRVSSSIAGQVQGLLSAASAAGINLGGQGYRDPSGQIATRRSNCGSSDYAIYQMPASQCHPPTARPGTSMHEQGLAIDFTANGSLIRSRSSAAFQWLAANAGSFGLHNLPSEPWHWSTNGN